MKQIIITLVSLSSITLFNGCTAALTEPEMDFEAPTYVEQMPAMEERQSFSSTGSIFGQGDNPLFSDHKAMHVNDIVRVVISETAKSSNVAAKALTENDTSTLGGGTFTATGGSGGVNNLISKANGLTNVGFATNSESSFAGKGSATKDASFTATVSARIVKVLKNGNYFIVGKRELLIDKQKQVIQLSGVIRPYDIDQSNKIDSAQMSEAKISYITQGDVDRSTEQAWGTKIVQSVWPF